MSRADERKYKKVQTLLGFQKKTMEVEINKEIVASTGKKRNTCTITGKYSTKVKYHHIGSTMIKKLGVKEPCKDGADSFAKGSYLSMIHSGVTKSISNYTILENYQTASNGMKDYHKFVTTSSTVFDKVTLAPPVEVAVTKNNINLFWMFLKTLMVDYIIKSTSLITEE